MEQVFRIYNLGVHLENIDHPYSNIARIEIIFFAG